MVDDNLGDDDNLEDVNLRGNLGEDRRNQEDPEDGTLVDVFTDSPAGRFLRLLIAKRSEAEKIVKDRPSKWTGKMSTKEEDPRVIITRTRERWKRTPKQLFEAGLADRSLYLEYKGWASSQPVQNRKIYGIRSWTRRSKFVDKKAAERGANRGKHFVEFERTVGTGVCVLLFLLPWEFKNLNDKEKEACAKALIQDASFEGMRQFIADSSTFINKCQDAFHDKHDIGSSFNVPGDEQQNAAELLEHFRSSGQGQGSGGQAMFHPPGHNSVPNASPAAMGQSNAQQPSTYLQPNDFEMQGRLSNNN